MCHFTVHYHTVSSQDVNLGAVCIAKDRANSAKLFKIVSLLQRSPDEVIGAMLVLKHKS